VINKWKRFSFGISEEPQWLALPDKRRILSTPPSGDAFSVWRVLLHTRVPLCVVTPVWLYYIEVATLQYGI